MLWHQVTRLKRLDRMLPSSSFNRIFSAFLDENSFVRGWVCVLLLVDTNRVFVVRFMNVVQNMAGNTGQIEMVVFYLSDMLLKSCEGTSFCLANVFRFTTFTCNLTDTWLHVKVVKRNTSGRQKDVPSQDLRSMSGTYNTTIPICPVRPAMFWTIFMNWTTNTRLVSTLWEF
jgi:hypothetical protein